MLKTTLTKKKYCHRLEVTINTKMHKTCSLHTNPWLLEKRKKKEEYNYFTLKNSNLHSDYYNLNHCYNSCRILHKHLFQNSSS